MTKKNKILIIIASVLTVVILIVVTVITLRAFNNRSVGPSPTQSIAQQAADYEIQADNAAKSGDIDLAKTLYEEARKAYFDNQENDKVPDIDGKLYLLDHPAEIIAPKDASKSPLGGGGS
jgi:predicted negative regulator of RcsB-dependent stress response